MWKLLLKRFIFYFPVKIFGSCHSQNPNHVTELNLNPEEPIVYVLQSNSISDMLTLEKYTRKHRLPNPFSHLVVCGKRLKRSIFLKNVNFLFNKNVSDYDYSPVIQSWINECVNNNINIQIIPVSIVWSRNPGKEGCEREYYIHKPRTAINKFFRLFFLGYDNTTILSGPINILNLTKRISSDKLITTISKGCQLHFERRFKEIIGPKIPNREKLIQELIVTPNIQNVIEELHKEHNIDKKGIEKEAYNILNEMASNKSYHLLRISATIMHLIWNKLYHGVNVEGAKRVRKLISDGHEIVYVPCHRSHMDYLLLSYTLFNEGLVSPHIVAGNNLNFFPINYFLRGCGAFFMRRKFKGDKLYTAIFKEYITTLFQKGYSTEFFIEGGRSRTGKTLPPRTGLVAMAVQAQLRGQKRPITFIPTYLGYEKVMEVSNYMNELKGAKKEKESVFQLFNIFKRFKYYGRGYVCFGEPISIPNYLKENAPNWQQYINENGNDKPSWLFNTVNSLSDELVMNLNESASINGLNLCALVLLTDSTHKMSINKIQEIISFYLFVLRRGPIFKRVIAPNINSLDLMKQARELSPFNIENNIACPTKKDLIYLSYFKNNILHFFVLPALIMTIIKVHKKITLNDIIMHTRNIFYFLRHELYVPIRENVLDNSIKEYVSAFQLDEYIISSSNAFSINKSKENIISYLTNCIHDNLVRYSLGAFVIKNHEDKFINENLFTQFAVEKCNLLPLSITNGSPEFSDPISFKVMFETFVRHNYISINKETFEFTKNISKLDRLIEAIGHLLPKELINDIYNQKEE